METKVIFSNLVKLLGAGTLSAICLVLISSGRLKIFSPDDTVRFLFYLQWQLLGLTIAKLGLDQLIYSWVIENKKARLTFLQVCQKIAIPIAFFAVISLPKFSYFELLVLVLSLFFDTFSLISINTLNALNAFRKTSFASYLNYPLFFF
jgi:hypothetical protein